MKKFLASVCVVAAAMTLAACEGTGNRDTEPPYSHERTASHGPGIKAERTTGTESRTVRSAEPVFKKNVQK